MSTIPNKGKRPIYKKWWFWLVAPFALLMCIGALNPSEPSNDTKVAQVDKTPQEAATVAVMEAEVKPEAAPAPTPVEEPKPAPVEAEKPAPQPSVLDRLWIAIDTTFKTREHIDVGYLADEKAVVLSHYLKEYWDENTIVRQGYADLVYYGQEAFKIDGVDSVMAIVYVPFTDQYGKTEEEQAIRIEMKKEEFQKYDWGNLKYDPVWEQIKNSSSIYFIHPGLLKGIKLDKLYLESDAR